jgi:hypothetical protein
VVINIKKEINSITDIIRTFKLYYRKLLVEYLMDLNYNEKEYTPITTAQAIMNIYI